MRHPKPLKLYGFGPSRSFRALWALEETGLAFEHTETTLLKNATLENSAKHPNYLALNSQGKVPTVVDGDKMLTESVAIVNYIARLASESKLIPTSVSELASYDELSCFTLAELEQPPWSKGKHLFALPEEQRVPAMFDTTTFEWAKAVRSLDDVEFALGDQFSAIDILLAHTFNWAQRFEFDVTKKFIALRDRHFARPAAQRALALMA